MKLEGMLCTNWLARARKKGHALSHAIQHSNTRSRDVDLRVVIECLKIADILRSKQANTHRDLQNILKLLSSRQHEQRPWIYYQKVFGSRHRFILAGFCIEMFDGGKWQRQHYFSFIFGIIAQFLNLIELLIFPFKGEGRISRLLEPKLSHTGACLLTNSQHVTLKSPKIAIMIINNQIID